MLTEQTALEIGADAYTDDAAQAARKALELLGKHFGMFTDNVRLSGDVGVQIIDDIAGTD